MLPPKAAAVAAAVMAAPPVFFTGGKLFVNSVFRGPTTECVLGEGAARQR